MDTKTEFEDGDVETKWTKEAVKYNYYGFDCEDSVGRTKEERKETTEMDSIAMITILRRSRRIEKGIRIQ